MHLPTVRVPRATRVVVVLAMAATVALAACSSSAAPVASDPNAQGAALVNQFFTILQQPAPAKTDQLKTFLTPEFQAVRATGDQLGKDAYLQNPPTVTTYTISDVKTTQGGDVMVVSYKVNTQETLNGVAQTTTAPRFSIFRYVDGAWKLAAHSNFGAITQ